MTALADYLPNNSRGRTSAAAGGDMSVSGLQAKVVGRQAHDVLQRFGPLGFAMHYASRMSIVGLNTRNNTSGVVLLITTAGDAPDQPKHGLELVTAVFAHVLLIDGVRAYGAGAPWSCSASRMPGSSRCQPQRYAFAIHRKTARPSLLVDATVLLSLTTVRPGLAILRAAFVRLTAMIVAVDTDYSPPCPYANRPMSTGVSRRQDGFGGRT